MVSLITLIVLLLGILTWFELDLYLAKKHAR